MSKRYHSLFGLASLFNNGISSRLYQIVIPKEEQPSVETILQFSKELFQKAGVILNPSTSDSPTTFNLFYLLYNNTHDTENTIVFCHDEEEFQTVVEREGLDSVTVFCLVVSSGELCHVAPKSTLDDSKYKSMQLKLVDSKYELYM